MKNRDWMIIKKINEYAADVMVTIERYELTETSFRDDRIHRHAISMCLLQIGELAGNLTTEFTMTHSSMPWHAMIGLRHRAAHDYGQMDLGIIWQTASLRIPELITFCEGLLKEPN